MATKFLNISTDNSLGGNSPSDEIVSSQKAIKGYVDSHTGGNAVWGNITGTLSNQTDLQNALNAKQDTSGLGSAAYTSSSDYATSAQGGKADTAVQPGDLENYVTTDTTQTISGTKTFTASPYIKNTTLDNTVAPSSYTERLLVFTDKNNVRIGGVGSSVGSGSTTVRSYISASKTISGTAQYSIIAAYIDSSGNKWTEAPTPAASDNSTKIATTAHIINVLKLIYPVGAIYIGTQNTCPMSAFFGTWTLVSSGKALWTGNGTNGNTTIAAGLPNITGQVSVTRGDNYGWRVMNGGGALSAKTTTVGDVSRSNRYYNTTAADENNTIDLNASSSNSIYGNSSTVQPPAYVVNVWRRTA